MRSRPTANTLIARSALTALLIVGVGACDRKAEGGSGADFITVADSLYAEGRWPEAAEQYAVLLDSLAETSDTAAYWQTLLRRSDAQMRLGQLDSARAGLDEALALAGDDPVREARTRYILSIWFDRQGHFDEAAAEAERTLELGRATGDRRSEWDGLNALGRIYSLTGRRREALEVHERYLALAREIGTRQEIALALNEIGIDYRRLGRFADAARAYEEALAIYQELENSRRIAMVSYNLGNIYFDRGELDEAARLYRLSLRSSEELGILRGQSFAHGALGAVYSQAGNVEAAREHLARALEIGRETGNVYGVAGSLANLGALELEEGRLDEAESRLTAALALADSVGLPRERATAHAGLARLAAREIDEERALGHARVAVAIADSLTDPALQYETRAAHGFALEKFGRDDAALTAYRSTIDLLESWRGRIAMGDLRLGVTQPRLEVYEGAIRVLLRGARAGEAFAVSERARARLLLDLVSDIEAPPPEETTEEDRLRERLRTLYSSWEDAAPEERDSLDVEIREVGRELVAQQEAVRRADPARSAARYPRPATLFDVQSALAGEDADVLAYFWGDRDVFGWRVSADGVTGVRLGSAESLSSLVGFLRETISDESAAADWRPPARESYEALVAPLAPTGETLWVIPDGQLTYLPFEVLIPGAGEAPWGVSRHLVYGPSASILLALRRASRAGTWEGEMLAVGEPELDEGDATLPPLPYAGLEVRALRDLFGPDQTELLLGDEATVEDWLASDPGRYRYLHFATHAVVSDRQPAATHLVFTGGRLDLAAIRSLHLGAELVTLSACETGLGRRVRGEGVIGLPHAFFAAGARGVVVTLWRVTDQSAAEFMTRFYRELRSGSTPAEALVQVRRAQMERGGREAHPSRWATFVLVGGARS